MNARLILIIATLMVGWLKIASMPLANWESMDLSSKKAIVNLITDKFFESKPHCTKAQFRICEGLEVEVYVKIPCKEQGL
jgi:hypothetical protein